ncbi:MAG: M15 family metallopeptidase, partial [Frankiales bacterium]|nr:M15 family metallopeptidase [Frankiales bacterium]
LGKTEQAAVDDLRLAEAAQHRSAEIASAAAATALATERGAQTAKQQAAVLVRQQRAEVRHERTLLAHTRAASAAATAKANALARRIQRAEARAAAIRAAQSRALAAGGAVAGCDGSSVAGYPNGRLPTKALCALWGAPGEMLQAAAAASFNRMSHAYASAFSTPLCVTASYRTYERQVELYATMPAGYAAVPGTSNHGWGLAVDLCGGIQVDNSPQHNWLLDHAAAYGWFHPAWAMPGGGGPHEPWHWEFSG